MKNALVTESGKNFTIENANNIWEVFIEDGKAEVRSISGLHGDTIEPSESCEDLYDFEQELSDRFDQAVSFSGLFANERTSQDVLISLQK